MAERVPAWVYMADVPPDTDEEPWSPPLDIDPARGILAGLALGLVLWALLGVVVWLVWPRG